MSYYSLRFAVQTNVDVISGSLNPGDYDWITDNQSEIDEYDDKIIVKGFVDSASWDWHHGLLIFIGFKSKTRK